MEEIEKEWLDFIKLAKNNHKKKIFSRLMEMHAESFPTLSQDELNLKIVKAFDKAMRYGFILDEHIVEFINLALVWGDDFDVSDKTPWAREILSWENTSNDAKIRSLIAKSEDILDTVARDS